MGKSNRENYIKFIEEYFGEVNVLYKDFTFQNGSKDLPCQMYVTLRCGIVHSFSLVPDATSKSNKGRPRSILLAHEMKGQSRFATFKNCEMDSVIFTAEQFAKDIKETIHIIFQKATTEKSLENQITEHVNKFPPIAGKNWIPSST